MRCRNENLLHWKVTSVPHENGCVCWYWHDDFDKNDRLGVLAFSLASLKGFFLIQSFFRIAFDSRLSFLRKVHEIWRPIEVDFTKVGSLWNGFHSAISCKSLAKLNSFLLRLGWAVDVAPEERFSTSHFLWLSGPEEKVYFFFRGAMASVVTANSTGSGIKWDVIELDQTKRKNKN